MKTQRFKQEIKVTAWREHVVQRSEEQVHYEELCERSMTVIAVILTLDIQLSWRQQWKSNRGYQQFYRGKSHQQHRYNIFTTLFIYICIIYYTIAITILYLSWMVFSNYDVNKYVRCCWPFFSVREIPSLSSNSIVHLYEICSYFNPKIMLINNYYYPIEVYSQRQ